MMEDNETQQPQHDPWEEPGAAGRALNRPVEPPPGQWEAIEARMKRGRRRGLFWLWPLGLLLLGTGWYGLSRLEREPDQKMATRTTDRSAASSPASEPRLEVRPKVHPELNHSAAHPADEAQASIDQPDARLWVHKENQSANPAVPSPDHKSGHSTDVHASHQEKPHQLKPSTDGGKAWAGTTLPPPNRNRKGKVISDKQNHLTGTHSEVGHPARKRTAPKKAFTSAGTQAASNRSIPPQPARPVPVTKNASDSRQTGEAQPAAGVSGSTAPKAQSNSLTEPEKGISASMEGQAKTEADSSFFRVRRKFPNGSQGADSAAKAAAQVQSAEFQLSDSASQSVSPKQERRPSRFYFGLAGLTFGDRTHVASYPEKAQSQYRVTELGTSLGAMGKVGYALPLNRSWSLSAELGLGFLTRQGRYRIQPGGGASFLITSADSMGYTAQPKPTTETQFRQTTGLAGAALLVRYQVGPVRLSAGGRIWAAQPLSQSGTPHLSLQPTAGLAFHLRPRLAMEATAQPYRVGSGALPLPLDSRSYGGLYSLGLIWELP